MLEGLHVLFTRQPAMGSPYSKYNFFSHYRHVHSGQTVFMLFKSKVNFFMSCRARNLYTLPANNAKYHHCQVVWNRMCFHKGPPIGQIARVVRLAMVKSNFVVHGVIAFIIGQLAWTQGRWAEAEFFPTRDLFYVHAEDGREYLTTALFAAIEFVLHLKKADPAFIKWGQWAATRPDHFPRDLCDELAEFQTKAPSHKFSYSRKCIEHAFGRKLYEIFEKFEEEPVASGSIAQVHRATLRYKFPGQQIKPVDEAVKVRHPEWLKLDENIQQFAVFMMSQVDLSREAAHLSRFIYNFRRWKDVSFPLPLDPLGTVSWFGFNYVKRPTDCQPFDPPIVHLPQA
ncbi:hypothetical protein VNO80_25471 [Phaseolus coccineus]|uniref:ABC1 atypical kinase-like domain-containing protein n=1 Tax=Phaseolus coccineus TaxID=3886 RepID=A0AAN9QQ61_PHACN